MKHYVLASHGGFSKGIYESIQIIIGEQPNIHIVQAFVEGNNDITSLVEETLAAIPPEDEVIVCSDVFGGSVNNEFMKQLRNRNHMHLITGMNLPLLMQLFLSVEEDTEKMIHDIVNSEDKRVKYCNDMLSSAAKEEEDF